MHSLPLSIKVPLADSHYVLLPSRSITRSYYRNTVGALLIYDITKRASFDHLMDWLFEVRRHIEPSKAIYQVVACKNDLNEEREVPRDEGKAFAEFYNIKYVETSAKNNENVDLAFKTIAQDIYDKVISGEFQLDDAWEGVRKGASIMDASLATNGSGYHALTSQSRNWRVNSSSSRSNRRKCC